MKYSFLKEEKFDLREQVTFVGEKLEIFIPSYFFDDDIAKINGNIVETLGLFWFKVDNKDLYECTLPLNMQFEFVETYKQNIKIKPEITEMEYRVFALGKNDAFLYNKNHKEDLDDLMIFISKLIEGGKLPQDISYLDTFDLFLKLLIVTGHTDLGVSALTLEFILMQLYRSKKNMSKSFRFAYNGHNPFEYKMVRITKVPELESTFIGLMGEDLTSQLVSAVVRNREGAKEIITPIEATIKY